MRRAAKTDANQAEIVATLRKAGCGVLDLSGVGNGCPDLLVHEPTWPHRLHLLEVKNLGGRGNKLTPDQEKFHGDWRGAIRVVTTVDEALTAVGIARHP